MMQLFPDEYRRLSQETQPQPQENEQGVQTTDSAPIIQETKLVTPESQLNTQITVPKSQPGDKEQFKRFQADELYNASFRGSGCKFYAFYDYFKCLIDNSLRWD